MSERSDYYEQLKKESYKSLLDAEVQASVARERAMKYTQNGVNASGFGGQGISESTSVGIGGQYQKALQDASLAHQQQLSDIQQQERAEQVAQTNDEFQSLTTLMNSATNQQQLSDILGRYGIKVGDDGVFDYGEGLTSFSDNDKRQLETIYSLYNEQLKTNEENQLWAGREFQEGKANTISYTDDGKLEKNTTNSFTGEVETLKRNIKLGKIPDGSYIRLRERDTNKNVYLIYRNGQFYYITPEEFNAAPTDNSFTIRGNGEMSNGKR